jgi:uncharacterized protein (TIGR00269 family)
MKCRICGKNAQVHLRQHNLALCREHFVERFEREVERAIRRHRMFNRDTPVLVAVSGGKDSLAAMRVLHRLGYNVSGLYIHLGIHEGVGYSDLSLQKVKKFQETYGLPVHILHLEQTFGYTIPALVHRRRQQVPCSQCGTVKRYWMNRFAVEHGFPVVVTGHNLDDEVATLLANNLRWDTGYLARQAPFLPSTHPRMAAKAKPFVYLSEKETALYALFQGIDYVRMECPFAEGAKSIFYKELLNRLEERSPGTKLRYYREFLRFREEVLSSHPRTPVELRACTVCGMPTTLEVCAYCRLTSRVGTQV